MDLPLSTDRLLEELNQIHVLITAVKDGFEDKADMPMNDTQAEIFQVQLRGEILLAAHRLMALAELLSTE